ncbi:protein recA isoform X1 [Zea mays]|uniref:DNA repair protein recA homolog 1 chloroplastic n=1 Tax=Zea mays TaxID=4577 RepID=C0HJ69_MAIZE|nr:protein recA isoform X1 [Zea mays]ACN27072.1 unknown [Zea mays]ONM07077.1 DNA repair protein recA homolog 1 chloroplastic [Zea mays]
MPMAVSAVTASHLALSFPARSRRRRAAPRAAAGGLTARARRLRCEFVAGGGNGALSGEDDPRLVDRQKVLDAAMNDINNSFGKGSVTRLGSAGGAFVETFPSGCLTLDFALGGGLPKGRVVEVYGPESSGKTTLALHAIAEIQKLGGNAMLVDAEHAFDPAYSKALGVDIENLIVCQPDNGEMALENGTEQLLTASAPQNSAILVADRMCRSGAIDLICIDSVSALTPRAEIEGEIGMQQMGLQARLMSQALRKMSGNASKAGCTLMFLNQIRYKIGVFYGNPEVTSGGIALKFFASVRLEIRLIGKIKSAKGDEDVGVKVRVRVQKSKVSRPYKQAEFEIIFGEGVSKLGCVLDCAELMDVVAKKGSWYSYKDIRLGQGREKALQYLRESPTTCDEIEKVVRAMIPEGSRHMSLLAFGQSSSTEDEQAYDEQ